MEPFSFKVESWPDGDYKKSRQLNVNLDMWVQKDINEMGLQDHVALDKSK